MPGAIENQQLLLDEYGLGHYRPHAARTGEHGDRHEVENQGSQVAHGNRNKRAKSKKR